MLELTEENCANLLSKNNNSGMLIGQYSDIINLEQFYWIMSHVRPDCPVSCLFC